MVGQSISIIIPPPWKALHDGYLKAYSKSGQKKMVGQTLHLEGLHKDQTVFAMSITVSELADPAGYVCLPQFLRALIFVCQKCVFCIHAKACGRVCSSHADRIRCCL